ncbi:PREDICTED: uncharacterized protein LOC105621809 [Atta cephalotes]|uniref:Uncharacterized protein n=1 Tax=Atta cephalotes TaxID=12957 RepID=A0A158NM92_ATTCE|nr:PREDICTED: uncharacterized protein LOC105621809 [Atta cephalotes]
MQWKSSFSGAPSARGDFPSNNVRLEESLDESEGCDRDGFEETFYALFGNLLNGPPPLKQLLDFIAHRCEVLEITTRASNTSVKKIEAKSQPNVKRSSSCAATVKPKCNFCQGGHVIYYCKNFVAFPISQRIAEIRSRKLCVNCLRSSSHASSKCTSGQCKPLTNNTNKEVVPNVTPPPSLLANYASESSNNEEAMLSTAVVLVCDSDSLAGRVKHGWIPDHKRTSQPRNLWKLSITDKIPAVSSARDKFNFSRNIHLADPRFHISSDIDLLIGVDLFWNLICVGQVKSSNKHPTLQKTRLGWILASRLDGIISTVSKIHSFHASVTNAELHEHVSRAWQMDDISTQSHNFTMEESICERHFLDNVSQNSQGRYTVKLPIKEQILNNIGDSRESALKRLKGIERRFKRDPTLKLQYATFLDEYVSLGRRVELPTAEETISFYLPHHCVFKTVEQASKIRVVFDASYRSSSGVSLNDALLVGPTVQQDLISILMRFRFFTYVITADIIKMYRQVLVHPSQTRLQRILWRNDRSANVDTYELTTVTYGTAFASFLATRCLKHLAEQHVIINSLAVRHVSFDFYVDDMLTGADTIDELKLIRDETIQLLKLGAFDLSKWTSNCPELLQIDNRNRMPVIIGDNATDSCILGMQWNQCQDTFQFLCRLNRTRYIKIVLSEVAKLLDPLGLLGPVIVIAKLIL